MILKRQLTAIYTHLCTKVYTSVRKILFLTVLKSFFKLVSGGSKIFESYLTKIIFGKEKGFMACLRTPIAVLAPAQVP